MKEFKSIREFKGRKYCNQRIQRWKMAWDIFEHPERFPTVQTIIDKYGETLEVYHITKLHPGKRHITAFAPKTRIESIFQGYPKSNQWAKILLNDAFVSSEVNDGTWPFDDKAPINTLSLPDPHKIDSAKEYFKREIRPMPQKIIRKYASKNAAEREKVPPMRLWRPNAFKCLSCGTQGDAKYVRGANIYPVTATMFTMEDGSKAISFIVRKEFPVYAKVAGSKDEYHKDPMYRYKEFSGRITFSANGHTYIKRPVAVDTGKKIISYGMWPYNKDIIDVTYVNMNDSLPNFFSLVIDALKKEKALPENCNTVNRFRNVSKSFISSLQKGISRDCIYNVEAKKKFTLQFCRLIDKNDNDLQIMNNISKKFHLPQSKKFKKMLMDDIYLTTEVYDAWSFFGFNDINSFYSLFFNKDGQTRRHVYTVLVNYYFDAKWKKDSCFGDFIQEFLKAGSEMTIVKALNETILTDARHAYNELVRDEVPQEDICRCFKPSMKKTHDALIELAAKHQELKVRVRARRNIHEQIQLYKKAKKSGEKDVIKIAKQEIIRNKLEEERKILYTEEEVCKYEKTVDGIKFILPRTTTELVVAGKKLHNCVGQCYAKPALFKNTTIVLMEKNGNLCGCIEVFRNAIRQAYGPCNKQLKDGEKKVFELWRDSCEIADKIFEPALPVYGRQDPAKELEKSVWAGIVEEYELQEYEEAA